MKVKCKFAKFSGNKRTVSQLNKMKKLFDGITVLDFFSWVRVEVILG